MCTGGWSVFQNTTIQKGLSLMMMMMMMIDDDDFY